jgi:hypothetical protein
VLLVKVPHRRLAGHLERQHDTLDIRHDVDIGVTIGPATLAAVPVMGRTIGTTTMTAMTIEHIVITAGNTPPPLTACGITVGPTIHHMMFGPPITVDMIPVALERIGRTICPRCAHNIGLQRTP